jgi:hypothetical protein
LTAAAALLAAAGCARPPSDYLVKWEYGMGYASLGGVLQTNFAGNEKGIEPGSGWSITMPPLLPVSIAALQAGTVGGDPAQALNAILSASAVSGVADQSRVLVSEASLDVTFSESWHRDADFGGHIEYESWLLGVRFGGPERYVPSYSFSGGWGWHKFECDSRPNASAEGPYLGAALQFFIVREVRIIAELRRHFFTADIVGDPPRDGAWQGVIGVTVEWSF